MRKVAALFLAIVAFSFAIWMYLSSSTAVYSNEKEEIEYDRSYDLGEGLTFKYVFENQSDGLYIMKYEVDENPNFYAHVSFWDSCYLQNNKTKEKIKSVVSSEHDEEITFFDVVGDISDYTLHFEGFIEMSAEKNYSFNVPIKNFSSEKNEYIVNMPCGQFIKIDKVKVKYKEGKDGTQSKYAKIFFTLGSDKLDFYAIARDPDDEEEFQREFFSYTDNCTFKVKEKDEKITIFFYDIKYNDELEFDVKL